MAKQESIRHKKITLNKFEGETMKRIKSILICIVYGFILGIFKIDLLKEKQ